MTRPRSGRSSRRSRPSRSAFASSALRTSTGPPPGRSTSTTPTASRSSRTAGRRRRSSRTPPTCATQGDAAEVAFLVADAWQGQRHLDDPARASRRHRRAARDPDVHRRGAPAQPPHDRGVPRERLPGRHALDARRDRDRAPDLALRTRRSRGSTSASGSPPSRRSRSFLEPRSVAVIGASRRRGTVGGEILRNLLATEFEGAVYAVNAQADVVQSLPAYHSITDIPGTRRAGVVVVPAADVVGGRARVRGGRRPRAAGHLGGLRGGGRGGCTAASASWSRSAATPACG